VLILKLRFGKSPKMGRVTEGGRYILKRAEELTPNEKEHLEKLDPFVGFSEFKKGYSDGEGNIIFFDNLDKLNKMVEYYQSFCDLKQVVPMKDKTKEHFGEIMEKTHAKTEGSSWPLADWVIILKFTVVGSDQEEEDAPSKITYTIKKTKDLTPREIEMIKTLTPFHGFSRYKKAFSKTGDDGLPIIAFFDTKKKVDWILWYYKQCGNIMTPTIPVKPKTKEYFGDLID
jgi:hypothetical protein